jgi:hypothetical protein
VSTSLLVEKPTEESEYKCFIENLENLLPQYNVIPILSLLNGLNSADFSGVRVS